MNKVQVKIELWQLLIVIIASAFAVIFLNSIAFGLTLETILSSLTHTFFISLTVCVGILYLAPKIYTQFFLKRFFIIAIAIFVTTIIGILLARIFLGLLYNCKIIECYVPGNRTIMFSLVISYSFGFGAYFYLHSQKKLRQTEELLKQKALEQAKTKALAVSAQLASLESRIHPHFLFNTLNSIASLIKKNPDQAEKMLEKLSVLLRYSLNFKSQKLVKLEDEVKITKDYLEIESARFTNKLRYKFDVEKRLSTKKVPAFSLQTLVENSVKHVASQNLLPTIINVFVFMEDGNLKIIVKDNGNGFSTREIKQGHGLDNLQERLENLYGNQAYMEIIKIKDGGEVHLSLPIDDEK